MLHRKPYLNLYLCHSIASWFAHSSSLYLRTFFFTGITRLTLWTLQFNSLQSNYWMQFSMQNNSQLLKHCYLLLNGWNFSSTPGAFLGYDPHLLNTCYPSASMHIFFYKGLRCYFYKFGSIQIGDKNMLVESPKFSKCRWAQIKKAVINFLWPWAEIPF